jgi:hypothetical protein
VSDLFSPLRDHEPVAAPPVEDVRRRGDRIRRTRRAVTGGVTVAAITAVVFAGQSVVTDRSTDTGPDVVEQPTEPLREIPADFDLGAGMQKDSLNPDSEWLQDVALCEASYSPADLELDSEDAVVAGGETFFARNLRVYDSPRTAASVVDDVVAKIRRCDTSGTEEHGESEGGSVTSLHRIDLTGNAYVVSQTYTFKGEPQPGETVLVFARVGNTVLAAQQYFDGRAHQDPQTADRNSDALVSDLRRHVVPQLECTFVTQDC